MWGKCSRLSLSLLCCVGGGGSKIFGPRGSLAREICNLKGERIAKFGAVDDCLCGGRGESQVFSLPLLQNSLRILQIVSRGAATIDIS